MDHRSFTRRRGAAASVCLDLPLDAFFDPAGAGRRRFFFGFGSARPAPPSSAILSDFVTPAFVALIRISFGKFSSTTKTCVSSVSLFFFALRTIHATTKFTTLVASPVDAGW